MAVLTLKVALPAFGVSELVENSVLDLQDCIELALQNSPKINMAKNYALAAKSRIGQAKSDYFPTLSVGTGYYGQFVATKNNSNNDKYYWNVYTQIVNVSNGVYPSIKGE